MAYVPPFSAGGLKFNLIVCSWDHQLSCVFKEFHITSAAQRPCFSRCAQQEQRCLVMSDFTLLAHNTCLWLLVPTFCSGKVCENGENCTVMCLANQFAHFCVILRQFAHHSPAHMQALCWSGDGRRRASADTVMACHDLFQLWLRALSQLETQGWLGNVGQSMLQLASSEKEACSDASSLSGRLF